MAPRHRLLVALVVVGELASEIDGLRRALGSRDLDRIVPHVTLVPPINVDERGFHDALELVREVASKREPLHTTLGPAATFPGRDDVVYLAVDDAAGAIDQLRVELTTGALAPPASRGERSFVAHVTLAASMAAQRSKAALTALEGCSFEVGFDRLALMEQDSASSDHRWHTLGEFSFARPAVVGRGGFEIELTEQDLSDPLAMRFFEEAWSSYVAERYGSSVWAPEPFGIVARYDGAIVAVARGVHDGLTWDLERLVVDGAYRRRGIGAQMLKRLEQVVTASDGTRIRLLTAVGGPAEALYRAHGYVVTAPLPRWRHGVDFVVMERSIRPTVE